MVIPVSSMLYGTQLSMSAITLPGKKNKMGRGGKIFSLPFFSEAKQKGKAQILYYPTVHMDKQFSNAHKDFTMCSEKIQ